MLTKGPISDKWLPYMRIIEFIGVLVAIGVVLVDFLIDRPTDRAVRRATMLAIIVQVAETAIDKKVQNPAVPILETLVRQKMDLSGLPLQRAELFAANLSGANLENADFELATLSNANLSGANLSGASFIEAYLDGANLGWANLGGAYFTGANLNGANLTGANLGGANLGEAGFLGAKGLTQEQLNTACLTVLNKPPKNLPKGLNAPTRKC